MKSSLFTRFSENSRCFLKGLTVVFPFLLPLSALASNARTECEKASVAASTVDIAINTCRQELIQEQDHALKANILLALGRLYSAQKETDIAISAWKEAGQYVNLKQSDSPKNEIWVNLQILTGQELFRTGRQTKAETHFLSQIEYAKKQAGMFSLTVAKLQESLGSMYALQNEQQKALRMFKESSFIYQMQSGRLSLNAVENQMSYGIALLDLGLQGQALDFFKELISSLNISQAYRNSLIMAEALTFLGTLQMRADQVVDAAKNFHDAYSIHESHFGGDKIKAVQVLNNFGVALFRGGYLNKAEEVLKQAYDIRVRLLGREDQLTQSSLGNLNAVAQAKANGETSKIYIDVQSIN